MSSIVVSTIIVFKNEENYIKKALLSLIRQNYPKEKYEIILVDGMSTDNTLSVINEVVSAYHKEMPSYKIEYNPKESLAAGWNIGIKSAAGRYVLRIDAHAFVGEDFILRNIEAMEAHSEASCVGGFIDTKVQGDNEIIPMVLSSPFGVGNSKSRYSDVAGYSDSVPYGLYKREVFDQVGYFDESLKRNQDIDLHGRMRKAGLKFYFDPAIRSTYMARDSFSKLYKQAFGNGLWNIVVFKKNRDALSIRHIIPFLFVLSLIGLPILSVFYRPFGMIFVVEMCTYLVLNLHFAIKKTKNPISIIKLSISFFCMHITYGVGSIVGLFCSSSGGIR